MTELAFGHLLRAGTTGFVVGCRVADSDSPTFGALVRVPLPDHVQIYGIIYDIHIDDDGLVRQLVTNEAVDEAVIADNRFNRNVPIEMSVLTLGYEQEGQIRHLLPPRPPLSLDRIYVCGKAELQRFTSSGRYGYFRHILRAHDLPISELLAVHIEQASRVHADTGEKDWYQNATQELITLLRDDYPTLMAVLNALSDISPG